MDSSVEFFRDWLVAYRARSLRGDEPPLPPLGALYALYTNLPDENDRDRPVVPAGDALNNALHSIHKNVIGRQNFRTQTSGVDNRFWVNLYRILGTVDMWNRDAARLTYFAYLNLNFSADYTYLFPNINRGDSNARVVLDVLPAAMASILGEVAATMNAQNAARHMKFLGPGANGKLDSIIVYCKYDDESFGELLDKLITLSHGEAGKADMFHDRLPLMARRIVAGVGYAQEPPAFSYGRTLDRKSVPLSFGEYRVILLHMAYRIVVTNIRCGRCPEDEFENALNRKICELFSNFGLDVDAPHKQGEVMADSQMQTDFIRTYAEWRHRDPYFYGDQASFRRPPGSGNSRTEPNASEKGLYLPRGCSS